MIPDCPGCNRKIQQMGVLSDQLCELSLELKREQKRSTHLGNTLQSIYGTAKDNMYYPCSFEDHEAVDEEQKSYTGERVRT